jgi:hypothetical protein
VPPIPAASGTTMVSICFVYAQKKHILIEVYRPNPQPQPRLGDTRLVIENAYARHILTVDKARAAAAATGGRRT